MVSRDHNKLIKQSVPSENLKKFSNDQAILCNPKGKRATKNFCPRKRHVAKRGCPLAWLRLAAPTGSPRGACLRPWAAHGLSIYRPAY